MRQAAWLLRAGLILALLAMGGVGRSAMAQAVYTVNDIPVDVTASDAVAAREQAIEEAQREGLRRLFSQLTPADQSATAPDVSSLPVEQFVRSFEIASEQVSPMGATGSGKPCVEAESRRPPRPFPPFSCPPSRPMAASGYGGRWSHGATHWAMPPLPFQIRS
jgi:hypothetical protein